ncbi:MAG: TonB-dependent receptor plug domain-containing protein [Bacteroidia bacterium]
MTLPEALTGRVAGLEILNPGSLPRVLRLGMRGSSRSLQNGRNQPLIVLDGVEIDNRISGPGATSRTDGDAGTRLGSGINQINLWDIASVTILKGPEATALSGSRVPVALFSPAKTMRLKLAFM